MKREFFKTNLAAILFFTGFFCLLALSSVASAVVFPISGDLPDGITYESEVYTVGEGALPDDDRHYIYEANVDFVDGSVLPARNWITTGDGCVVNFYNCDFGESSILSVECDAEDPAYDGQVTFHGTVFKVNGIAVDPPVTELFLDGDTLSGLNADGEAFEVLVYCHYDSSHEIKINLVWLDEEPPFYVDIDIRPTSETNAVCLSAQGTLPVAILSTGFVNEEDELVYTFDATQIDEYSVLLAGASYPDESIGQKTLKYNDDVNGDELVDCVVQVLISEIDQTKLIEDEEGNLFMKLTATANVIDNVTGTIIETIKIEGMDTITLVPPED